MDRRTKTDTVDKNLKQLFDDTRKRLVETGTRNRLVHVNRANARGSVINVTGGEPDNIFDVLSRGRAMRFLALENDKDPEGDIVLASDRADDGPEASGDGFLATRMGPDALQKKLLKIARDARTAVEEQGVSVLYLALGFLKWFEDPSSDKVREAPLVLLPVELKRNERSSRFDLILRDDDLLTNLPLQRRLEDDFGIKLPEIETEDEWRPSDYFDAVEAVISGQPRWQIDRNGIQLGFFSFSKLLMYLDLDPGAWPAGSLESHQLTRGLLFEGFEGEQPLFKPEDRLDDVLPPEKLFHVVDADASQAKVIEEVRTGRNLVVQGPPGTGKSQTITNIIAAAVREGKTVLFVAEKMAALSVVHDRLVKHGLRDICLEIHSKSANKKAVLAELANTLQAGQAIPSMPDAPEALKAKRDELNEIDVALHTPIGHSGETPYMVLGTQARLMGLKAPPPKLDGQFLSSMTRVEEASVCSHLEALGDLIAQAGPLDQHPFSGTTCLDLQPVAVARLATELESISVRVEAARQAIDAAMLALGLGGERSIAMGRPVQDCLARLDGLTGSEPEVARSILGCSDLGRLNETLDLGARWQTARRGAENVFAEHAYSCPVEDFRGAIATGAGSLFARWGGAYRQASRAVAGLLKGPLPRTADERLALVDQLLDVRQLRGKWATDEAYVASAIGPAWRGEQTEFVSISRLAHWCKSVLDAPLKLEHGIAIALASDAEKREGLTSNLASKLPAAQAAVDAACQQLGLSAEDLLGSRQEVDLAAVAARFRSMAASAHRYEEWVRLSKLQQQLKAAGLAYLTAQMTSGEMTAQEAQVELRLARAERLWREAVAATPILKELGGRDRGRLVNDFASLERQRLRDNVSAILAAHLGQLPRGAQGEMAVVRGEIAKRKRHMPLRQLFRKAPNAIQRIKPVLLMSPISVAQFLEPGKVSFDLLVFDEASQVRPEDALGAIARAKQIVVVGDQKQLPPTSFFDRLVADDGDVDADEDVEELLGGAASAGQLESILSLCEARGLSSRMLQWHYRSRDPALIRVSNSEFYRSELILPPSPLQKDPAYGLTFTRVDGVYDKGGRRDNRKEGQAIVACVAQHARATPDQSLGIVTFSAAQQNTVELLLEEARRADATLDAFLREGKREDLFIKNIENVQGDERDVILVSVGYGPTVAGGRLTSMSFGPVNSDGGERRLNVLFTRARIRCEVFASFDPGDIDVSRTTREGPRILRRFLEFAKTGQLDDADVTGDGPDSAFEEDVADVIRQLGYLADPQVGSAGFRIDIGVRHPDRPGTYLLAVECDGATYHSALWARERDRLRQEVLEHLGWRFHRIWSTDWFYSRRNQIERLRSALESARQSAESGIKVPGANFGAPPIVDQQAVSDLPVAPPVAERQMPAYRQAHFRIVSDCEPHEAPPSVLAPLIRNIVAYEGPICVEEVARRVASCFDRERAGRRILEVTRRTLLSLQRSDRNVRSEENGDFWFTDEQAANPPVRDRSDATGATLKAESLPLLEIRQAISIAREDNPGGSDDDIIRSAARLLGFKRVGSDLRERISLGL